MIFFTQILIHALNKTKKPKINNHIERKINNQDIDRENLRKFDIVNK